MDWPLSAPDGIEEKILYFEKEYPRYVECAHRTQFSGRKIYAITVTDREITTPKRSHIFTVPHIGEIAGTMASMNYINQLLEGKNLDGTTSDLDREKILRKAVVTFIPDGNPGARLPDRSKDAPNGRSERLDENTYVDVNADERSNFVKLVLEMHEKYDYNQFLDLHQAGKSPTFLFLPAVFRLLKEEQCNYITRWGQAILEKWLKTGCETNTDLQVAYEGADRNKAFINCYHDLENRAATLTLEVQRENPDVPPSKQMMLEEIGIRVSVDWMLEHGSEWR